MWIGTVAGLYLLDRDSGDYQYIAMPVESSYINTLYQSADGLLYIGTNGSGVLTYDHRNKILYIIIQVIVHWFLIIYIPFYLKWMDVSL